MRARVRHMSALIAIAALALTAISATPASATDPTLTIASSVTVDYGQSVTVPVTYTGSLTGFVSSTININNGRLDMATYINSHLDLAITYGDATSSTLTVVGTLEQINDFLANVRVHSIKDGTRGKIEIYSDVRSASAYIAIDPASGHAYEAVANAKNFASAQCLTKYFNTNVIYDETNAPSGDHCYDNGRTLVARTFQGVAGHMATIESNDESQYIVWNANGYTQSYWLGGSDATTDGTWNWTTGPSNGTQFWSGDSSGSAVNGAFTNWTAGQPVATTGSTDATMLVWTAWSQGTWTAADSNDYYNTMVEYEPTTSFAPVDGTNLSASGSVEITNFPVGTCVDYSDGFNQYANYVINGATQATRWEMNDDVALSGYGMAKSPAILETGSHNSTWDFDISFDSYWSGQTKTDQFEDTCVIFNADGSVEITADSTPFDMGNGVTVQYKTKFFNDGATTRQSVTYSNTSGSSQTVADVRFNGYLGSTTRHMISSTSYGTMFATQDGGATSVLWGGSSTTVVNGGQVLSPVVGVDSFKYADLESLSSRLNQFQNLPGDYLNGISGTIANWGGSSVEITRASEVSEYDGSLDLHFALGNLAPGATKSIVVFTETRGLGVLNRPRWNDSFAPNNASIVNDGSEVAQNFGMVDNNDIYTFAITNGALPNGLSLNTHTGEVSGTTTDALGDYSFDITATPDAAFPEFSEQSRSFTITLVAFDHNYSFEDETMSPWTAINRQIDLGVDSIAGCQTVDTQDYSVLRDFTGGFDATDSGVVNGERAGVEDNTPVSENGYEGPPTFHSFISTSEVSDGSFAMELNSSMQPIKYGYDVVHGPAVYSNEFTANTDQVYAFDWKAVHQSDAYAVVGYLLNTSTCAQTEVIDSVGDETSWTKAAVHIPSNGTYRFVFVSGTYDKTGGRAAGAYLYLDNFQMGPPVMPHWTDEIVTDGTIGTAYTNQVVAQGFPDPVHTIVGGSLPSGLSMDAHGNITGTPTELGQFTFKVKADNGIGTIYTTVTINITDGSLPDVHWSDQTLPIPFEERVPLNDGVTAVMPGTITYSISNGSLPAGLTLNPATGAITGTPTVNGDYWFQVTATNGTDTLVASFAGIINPAPPVPMVAPANATYQWSGYNTKINWDAADQAVRYVVKWRGVTLCTTTKTSCTALGLVPNDQHVTIIAYDINGLTASGPVVFISGLTRANVTPLFANNSAKLTASYKAKLKTLALYLKAHGITNVTLIGYTDITGPKSIDSGLSIARAKAVKAYMSKFMSTKKFTIRGSGRSNPVKANTTAAGRAANRRVEIWYK